MVIDAAEAARGALSAVSSLSSFFTGGIITIDQLRATTALVGRQAAFDAQYNVNPIIILRGGDLLAIDEVKDSDAQELSAIQRVEVHVVASRSISIAALDTHVKTIYKTLESREFNGYHFLYSRTYMEANERELGHSRHVVVEFQAHTILK
jgi:hypothetical protein